MRKATLAVVTGAAFLVISTATPKGTPGATAVPATVPSATAEAEAAGKPAPQAEKPVEVNGFRSVRFGMTEEEVRKTAAKDLGIKPEALKAEDNPLERTRVLTARVADLLPKTGSARVAYTFGHSSRKLIQVTIKWSKALDASITSEHLLGNAGLLRDYFLQQGFKPENVVVNRPANGGIVVFRGLDPQNRMVLLTLAAEPQAGAEKRDPVWSELQIAYVADPVKPDVYRIPPGQF
ncbi:hypothetical protein [Azospirillum thermophilum]|uniref:Uncharacterized protein n=1 Tax=Azospirillum thermophilum TaxID=2202148 RepID=A0A2S2CZ27_9PROT|nr:hypothetical protein [Azospirillum thermophilum]AWK89773.1 hypothetical protein DEW08_27785 [Azospirillum thermophilum]